MAGSGAGMDRRTGRWISGWAHCNQSLGDVLSTPLETRVMRRPYGAAEDALLDKPQSKGGLTAPVMAVAVPVARWEPRVQLQRVSIASASVTGKLGLNLATVYMPRALYGDFTPEALMMSGIER
jgi:phage baseplate assembly protein W